MTLVTILSCLLLAIPFGMTGEPVSSRVSREISGDTLLTVSATLAIQQGWHVYSTDMPSGGPVGASVTIESMTGLEKTGELQTVGNEIDRDDPVFGMHVRYFENSVTLKQEFRIIDRQWNVSGYMTYASCNDESCVPPHNLDFEFCSDTVVPADSTIADASVNVGAEGLSELQGYDANLWAPADYDRMKSSGQDRGMLWLFLTGFLGGLLALLTPCVWPVIPMTVSFFLKRAENRRSAIRDAIIYGVSIVAVYVALGLLVTLIFGASALNSLSTNAIVNLLFFALLVTFALSFFGLFDITLPSGWSTGVSRKSSDTGGVAGIFLMALTLSIVSFSCTGPIIGFLLVDAASTGGIAAPALGMTAFSLALAIPFALFAMFPQWLKSMPKSGGWMDKVKVTLGFVELAFSLKFLSVADMAYGWGILPRDLFIILWIAMAVLLGLYLLGVVRFHKDGDNAHAGWLSISVAIVSFLFALWMVPGIWGTPLRAISAFTPPMSTQHIKLKDVQIEPDCTDFNEAITLSKSTGKPILLDFTGYGCVNCRKMEASVWTDPDVAAEIRRNFILTSLFVDDKTPLDKVVTVSENGSKVKLRTVGDKWSLLQRLKFGANAQPFYVIIDADGRMLSGPYTFDTDVRHFISFLNY